MKSPNELVDEASMDSFPASDPPSFWARDHAGSAAGSHNDESKDPDDTPDEPEEQD